MIRAGIAEPEAAKLQSPCRVAAVSGAPSEEIQSLLRSFAASLRGAGFKVVGATETRQPQRAARRSRYTALDLKSGAALCLSQDLGSGSTACNLDVSQLARLSGELESAIAEAGSADLLIVSKFGKEEAEGRGLRDVFARGLLADIPILTAVNPKFFAAWHDFVGDMAGQLPANLAALNAWWRGISPKSQSSGDGSSQDENSESRFKIGA